MDSKIKFRTPNLDLNIFAPNDQDGCSSEDFHGYPHSRITSAQVAHPKFNMPKVGSWHAYLSEIHTPVNTPNDTPTSSPSVTRKDIHGVLKSTTADTTTTKRWFNSNLFGSIVGSKHLPDGNIQKSHSYKNVSNFDINAIGPISF